MKVIVLMGLCLLAGCSSQPTLEQLEAEALVTGDWSAVERRESMLERRKQRVGMKCPGNSIKYCADTMLEIRCTCLEPDLVYSAFSNY